MSGLHFTITDAFWPFTTDGLNLIISDEEILFNILQKKGQYVDPNRTFRPVHGIHFSPNRPLVGGGNGIPGWGADPWKNEWRKFENTDLYKQIFPLFDEKLKIMIRKLNNYYNSKEK